VTSIACWPGVDSRGQTSLYVASDSRFSWRGGACDERQKTFVSSTSLDIFAFCGAVAVPVQVLNKIEADGLPAGLSAHERHQRLLDGLRVVLGQPFAKPVEPFTILHGSRDGANMTAHFSLHRVDCLPSAVLLDTSHDMPAHSSLAISIGTGQTIVERQYHKWMESGAGRTSRAVFSAFCDALQSAKDPMSGGAPQLVALVRSGPAHHIGVITRGVRCTRGRPVALDGSQDLPTLWRNTLFERCDPVTMQVLAGAQRHARPLLK
jgi:hypothetical protein